MGLLRAKDLIIRERHYDANVDGYLVVGQKRKKDNSSLKNHVVGWISRHKDQLHESRYFMDKGSAKRYYNQVILNDHKKPECSVFMKDWQKQKLYSWENTLVKNHGLKLNEKQAKSIIRKVSREYGIPAPKLKMEKITWHSEYDDEKNIIHFGSRDNITLLHELAHAIHTKQLDDELAAHHSPGFTWIAIELYHKYAGLNLNYLILGASANGLLGDLNEKQLIHAESNAYFRMSKNAKKICP
jgi:hypothetical protein